MTKKQRTIKQNSSLHLYLTMLSDELNDAGYSMMKVLKHDAEIPWTPLSAKEFLFRPIIKTMYGKSSTKDLTTKELTLASEVLARHLAEKLGIECDWPSMESLESKRN